MDLDDIFVKRARESTIENLYTHTFPNCIRTKDIIAANNRILTRRSSNCSNTSCQMDLPENFKDNKLYSIKSYGYDEIYR